MVRAKEKFKKNMKKDTEEEEEEKEASEENEDPSMHQEGLRVSEMKEILNNNGEYRYHHLNLMNSILEQLKRQNEIESKIGQVLINIGESLNEE